MEQAQRGIRGLPAFTVADLADLAVFIGSVALVIASVPLFGVLVVNIPFLQFTLPPVMLVVVAVIGMIAAAWGALDPRDRRKTSRLLLWCGIAVAVYLVLVLLQGNLNPVFERGAELLLPFLIVALVTGILVGQASIAREPESYVGRQDSYFSARLPVWKRMTGASRSEALTFYLWIAPWLLGFLVWQLWPMIESFYLSFTNFRLLNLPQVTGLANVERMVQDNLFWQSIKVTLIYVLGSVPISTIFALFVAMVLAQKLRLVNTWRTIFFMPSVVAGVAVAVMWSFIFNPDFGLLNTMLSWFGIQGPLWISSENWALPAVILVSWWSTLGSQMVIYLAGIKGIPALLYEAAEIDGAGPWAKFRHVTLPMLSPTIFFNVVIGIIGAFQVFDTPFVLTEGGPNYATHVYIINVYEQAFINTNMGYASLLAWVLFIIIVVMTLTVTRYSRSRVYYETEVS